MKVLVGKIVKPQGLKGELKIYPQDTNLDIYKNIKNVYIENDINSVKILHKSLRMGFVYLLLQGISNRDIAEKYRNKKVYVDDSEIVLSENTYYTDKLLNMEVVDTTGKYVGIIVDIESYGAADVLTILQEDKREYKIPFLTSIVINISKNNVIIDKKKYDEAKICE